MIAEFSIYPMDDVHAGRNLARVAEVLGSEGLPYRLGPLGTCVEGEWDQVMAAIRRCQQATAEGHERVITTIVIDDRKTNPCHLDELVRGLEQHLGGRVPHGDMDVEC